MPVDLEAPEIKAAIKEAVDNQVKEKIEAETGGLKTKNNELLDEVKNLKKKFEGFDPDEFKRLKEEKRASDDKDSDPVQMRQRIEAEFQPKIDAEKTRADSAESKLNATIIDNQLTAALVDSGVAKEFLRAVKADLSSARKIEVKDDGVIVDGKPVGDFVKAWSATDGKPFISAGGNSGGGSGGGGGGGADSKKIADMTRADKAEFIRTHGREKWQQKVDNESN